MECPKDTRLYLLPFVLIAIVTTGLYLLQTTVGLTLILKRGNESMVRNSSITVNVVHNLKNQKDRVMNLHKICQKYGHLRTAGYNKHTPVFYAATRYNWSYCKIGKIGSTLWTQFFYILHHDGEVIKNVLTKSREDIHNEESLEHLLKGVANSKGDVTRMILSARNPYTRLFSAYIDRMFIPSTSISVRGEKDFKCKSQITFQEFLQFVISNTRNGRYDYHWSPVFYLCKPCEINPTFIFKQETFKNDLHFILNQTRLEPYKLDVLSVAIAQQSNWTGYALVDDVLDYITPTNQRHTRDCQTWEQVTKRLWEALKIQGFISEKVMFPSGLYKNSKDYENSNIFRQALRNARKNYPLTKTGTSLQRRQFMTKFYSTVDNKIIEGIKDVYSVDFEMFGYNNELPLIYPFSTQSPVFTT